MKQPFHPLNGRAAFPWKCTGPVILMQQGDKFLTHVATSLKHIITSRPRGYEKKKLCSTKLNMKFFLLINVKMPTIVGIFLTFMSRKNSILGLSEPKKS